MNNQQILEKHGWQLSGECNVVGKPNTNVPYMINSNRPGIMVASHRKKGMWLHFPQMTESRLMRTFPIIWYQNAERITTKEAGKIMNVTPVRIRQFIQRGRLPAVKRGRDLFILRRDLEKIKDLRKKE